jgi:hypothetical protein
MSAGQGASNQSAFCPGLQPPKDLRGCTEIILFDGYTRFPEQLELLGTSA